MPLALSENDREAYVVQKGWVRIPWERNNKD